MRSAMVLQAIGTTETTITQLPGALVSADKGCCYIHAVDPSFVNGRWGPAITGRSIK